MHARYSKKQHVQNERLTHQEEQHSDQLVSRQATLDNTGNKKKILSQH